MRKIGVSKYPYENAFEWLEDHLSGMTADELRSIVLDFAASEGSDGIQEMFQSDMDADGFFTAEICIHCDGEIDVGESIYSTEGYSPLHEGCATEIDIEYTEAEEESE